MRSDDLAPFLTAAPADGGQSEPVDYRTGKLLTWNPLTWQNTVLVSGSEVFHDLPVVGIAEVDSYVPGDTVALQVVGNSWAIAGQFVRPNTPKVTTVLKRNSERVKTDFVAQLETITSIPFADAPIAFGPQVTVRIGASGNAMVYLGADINGTPTDDGVLYGYVGSGANTIAASANSALLVRSAGTGGAVRGQVTLMDPLTGLNPGDTTFTAKYATVAGGGAITRRRLTVVAL